MKYKVRIKKLPQARMGYQVQGGLRNDYVGLGGGDYNANMNVANTRTNKYIGKDPREESNLEAEGGETVLGDINFDGFPEHYTIKGPRHAQGGVPLKLPEDTFIFSDFREMKIKDPDLLEKFGKVVKKASKQKSYTPAQLAKQYDINHYRAILQDPNSDHLDRKTAELMIRNFNMKLGALALAQEAKKGFPQGIPMVAQPFMEANGLSEQDFIPQEEEAAAAEQGQPEMQQEEPVAEATIPQQMPSGEPIAQPQPMGMNPKEMMMASQMPQEVMQQAPMAMYGLEMGGFYPEMAFGGYSRYDDGGGVKRKYTAEELSGKVHDVTNVDAVPEGYVLVPGQDGVYGTGEIVGRTWTGNNSGGGGGTFDGSLDDYVNAICNRMKNGDLKGLTVQQVITDAKAFYAKHSKIEDIKAKLRACETLDEKTTFVKLNKPPDQECVCKDKDGKEIIMKPDANGKCPCEEEEKVCYCLDEQGQKIEVPCGPGGTEPDCASAGYTPNRAGAKYWIQDTRNSVNAFMDMARLKKYLPFTPRVDLEEPRPYWLDPTRQFAALGERASTEAMANAQFAGPQSLGARNAAAQAATLQGIADIGSGINNQNVMLGNQYDNLKTDIRNKENLLRADAETKDFMGTTIMNQQFDNAVGQALDAQTLAANTADTNKYKTDALNQMYPNYQVDPSVGGQMYYNPTYKEPNPIRPEDELAYAQSLKGSGLDPDVQRVMMANWYKSRGADNSVAPDPNVLAAMYGQKGGPIMFRDGGFIYMAYPMFL